MLLNLTVFFIETRWKIIRENSKIILKTKRKRSEESVVYKIFIDSSFHKKEAKIHKFNE